MDLTDFMDPSIAHGPCERCRQFAIALNMARHEQEDDPEDVAFLVAHFLGQAEVWMNSPDYTDIKRTVERQLNLILKGQDYELDKGLWTALHQFGSDQHGEL